MARKSDSPENPIIQKVVGWAIVALGTFLANIISTGVDHIRRMGDSVADLNKNIVVIVERLQTHDKKLDKHESEIDELKRTLPERTAER